MRGEREGESWTSAFQVFIYSMGVKIDALLQDSAKAVNQGRSASPKAWTKERPGPCKMSPPWLFLCVFKLVLLSPSQL